MKTLTLALAFGVVFTGSAFAQNGVPSAKATADINTLVTCKMSTATNNDAGFQLPASCMDIYTGATVDTTGGWIQIMDRTVKLSNSQSLFVSPSLASGLYTRTRTKTQDGTTSTAQAMGAVYLRAVLTPADGSDDIVAAPLNACSGTIVGCSNAPGSWGVILDSRIQTLTQDITACTVLVDNVGGTCDFTSTIDFVLQTSSANTFNFVFPRVGQGTYTLKIYAAVGSGASIVPGSSGSAVGAAAFGLGSVTAEVVRLVHDFEF